MKLGDIVRIHDNFGKCFDYDGYLFNGKSGIVLSIADHYRDITIFVEGKIRSIHAIYLEVISEKRARG